MEVLFKKYFAGQCSQEEARQLLAYFGNPENELLLKKLIRESIENEELANIYEYNQWDIITDQSYLNIKKHIDAEKLRVLPFYMKTSFKIAASILIIIAAFALFMINNKDEDIAKVKIEKGLNNDIAPGGNKAILTLADNTQIILDSAGNGSLANQGNVKVIKINGQVEYKMTGASTELVYNTITTPRGGQYALILADGSKVWLNAASSLRFPTSFVGKERKVELTGEAYFEIAKNASMPFKVNIVHKAEVEVLGTHFNINSYGDEAGLNTTLLEGSVKVTELSSSNSKVIAPGQQAHINIARQISVNKKVNTEEIIAWKNGIFHFSNADLQKVLRELARWYDVNVSYKGTIPQKRFNGEIGRNLTLKEVLEGLDFTNVKFRIEEGRNLIILP